jgi:thiamine-monophosphate kinase
VAEIGEFGLIELLSQQLGDGATGAAGVSVGIGDDACVLAPTPGRELLVTCDSLVEGRHFLTEFCSPEDVGRRAAAVNLSDVGAMGGEPRAALVSLGLRPETPVSAVEALYRGLSAEFSPLGVAIAGGNCTAVPGPCFVDVTLLGEVGAGRAVRRSDARVGDAVLVTGHLGMGAAGLAVLQRLGTAGGEDFPTLSEAYRRPRHRAQEGRELGSTGLLHAMIDISDGLLGDAGHLARASGVGVTLWVGRLPVHPELIGAAGRLGVDPLDWILGASDDYQLLFTCAQEDSETLVKRGSGVTGVPVTRIGKVGEEPGVWLEDERGERHRAEGGWDHFRKSSG